MSGAGLPDLTGLVHGIPGLGLAINKGIEICYGEAIRIVRRHAAAGVAVANALIEKRALTGDVARLVAAAPVGDRDDRRTAVSGPSGQVQGQPG